ncbi:RelA/SpoT family protein [Dethiosulfovibrio salsuginis]|uniref:GTP pyrophosphokinase n=1 Tax=Dethiosulfovibrio salsuginis TaxID=561720 RepID=A0A1X7JAI1_9BACT|nr:bifunctional (p)ppGpp synthetase/guanosine-3',5'-bis(diphosphate) 3'-pyrophosphohydrolase [Dethiosulfovibrio salsuginis]SMG24471.1 GTP pyrophosphokinase [Dethiosulfovibrio salsuginis]
MTGDVKKTSSKKEMFSLRDSFMGRIPESQRSVTVKFAWQELWSKVSRYLSREELMDLGEALIFAAVAHGDQKRGTGEPYIIHCVYVASLLADMKMDLQTMQAALLHDCIEDTVVTKEELVERFGSEVGVLVDGVTKLGKLPFKSFEDYQAENLRKMFLVMAKDIRVVLIKLADRTHNMRTLGALRKDKQQRIAKETLEIYAPLAHRLGIYQVKRTLEDLAFKYYDPNMYYEIRKKVQKRLPEREATIKKAIEELEVRLKDHGIDAFIKGRAKHFYSILEKMNRKGLSVDQLYDLLAMRVTVDDVTTCYTVLGIVHTVWKPIPGQFDDYIANPKNNMYQSLHTTVVGPSGEPMEVQIRTWEMHWLAEYGVAAHWRYKEGSNKMDDLDTKLEWIRQAIEGGQETRPEEFMERLKDDVLTSDVFVFTPQGDVKSLPRGASPVDFAFAVHTQVGNQYVGAMVNNRIVPADYELQNGDIVKVLTSPQGKPSRDWLKVVKSSKAKLKIRNYFKHLDSVAKSEAIQRGRELLDRELKKRYPDQSNSHSQDDIGAALNKIARDMGYNNGEDVFYSIGSNAHSPGSIAARISAVLPDSPGDSSNVVPDPAPQKMIRKDNLDIFVEGAEGVLVKLSDCCKPVPGDSIVGFSTRVRGITVHRENCANISKIPSERLIQVSWGHTGKKRYEARIIVDALDRPGLFSDVAQAVSQAESSLPSVKANQIGGGQARMKLEVTVRNLEHLYTVIARINTVKNVIDVNRG